ncbi:Hypothetical_protein [Hexamita inflata]|uniref:Hypothetical_protein n=1 Tax=Hexamita inflata TaxID=28002 RepID=A0AA86NY43_9EUKA|nr:Hypothetical protein HINF_LOCUS15754 [Hexamita inflata]
MRLLRASRSIRQSTCVVPSAFLRKQWSGCRIPILKALMMSAQHFESEDFTFRNRFGRATSRKAGCGEEREAQPNESIIDHTKQSRYSGNATSALTLTVEPNRQAYLFINNYLQLFTNGLGKKYHYNTYKQRLKGKSFKCITVQQYINGQYSTEVSVLIMSLQVQTIQVQRCQIIVFPQQ